tara:strand:+ start:11054 stop:11476 length:423 start_codon:yes stop_codon:yes gene_type:complete
MIQEFVTAWDQRKHEVELALSLAHPDSYDAIVKEVVKILSETSDFASPDPERIVRIDDGDYQGTMVYIIGATGYQPSDYWFVKVSYGSCSGCDALANIEADSERDDHFNPLPPTEGQLKDYMSLALHILQGLKELGGETV